MPTPRPTAPSPGSVASSLGFLAPSKGEEGNQAPGTPVFRITSEVLDRVHDRVIGDGLKVEAFNRNPVLLWNHQSGLPAIGTAKVYRDTAGQWLMQPEFDGIGDLSKEIAAKVAAGTLRTCSIRFRYLKHAYNDDGGIDVLESELLEVSITNIPCNPEAVRVKNGNPNDGKKNDNPEEEPAKALEQEDLDAIRAVLEECLQPIKESMSALTQKMAEMEDAYQKMEPAEPQQEPQQQPEKSFGIASLFIR